MPTVAGNYSFRLMFGGRDVLLDPGSIISFTITNNLFKYLPYFRLKLRDSGNELSLYHTFDNNMGKVSIEIFRSSEIESDEKEGLRNLYNFQVMKRNPKVNIYDIEGCLDISNFKSPNKIRGWSDSFKNVLTDICVNDFGLKSGNLDISPSLSLVKTFIQPSISNSEFLDYHIDNVIGSGSEGCYVCNFRCVNGDVRFLFKTIGELVQQKPKFLFSYTDTINESVYPFYTFDICDFGKLITTYAAKNKPLGYFDYITGQYLTQEVTLDEFPSLCDYHLVNEDETNNYVSINMAGRSNDFTPNYLGRLKKEYFNGIINLTKLKIFTMGLPNIAPGDTVEVVFIPQIPSKDLGRYQYSGRWLVEEVKHIIEHSFGTELLLTRNGYNTTNTDVNNITTLVKAKSWAKGTNIA
jgi:hypothetical protein